MDRLLKLNRYAEAGVSEYWLVDPAARTVEFHVSGGGRFVVYTQEGGSWESPAVSGVGLDIDGLWDAVERKFGP